MKQTYYALIRRFRTWLNAPLQRDNAALAASAAHYLSLTQSLEEALTALRQDYLEKVGNYQLLLVALLIHNDGKPLVIPQEFLEAASAYSLGITFDEATRQYHLHLEIPGETPCTS